MLLDIHRYKYIQNTSLLSWQMSHLAVTTETFRISAFDTLL